MILIIKKIIARLKKPREKQFTYHYLRYPFDDTQSFTIKAPDQEKADQLAKEKYEEMVDNGETVLLEFWAA